MKILVAAATILIAGSAVAGPCETAKRGTYLSNVCWLFEDFSALKYRVIEADEKNCTVNLERDYRNIDNWDVKKTEGYTLFLDRANLKESKVDRSGTTTCLRLRGEKISFYRRYNRGGNPGNSFTTCGSKEKERVLAATRNLYGKYCSGKKSEF